MKNMESFRVESDTSFLELSKSVRSKCAAAKIMQRCRHRVAAPLTMLTYSMAATGSTKVSACIDMLSRTVAAGAAQQSSADTMRSYGLAQTPARMLLTPCTDAEPPLGHQTRILEAAAQRISPSRQERRKQASACITSNFAAFVCRSHSGQAHTASRAFATEAPQTQAEKFDIIQQESGAVRLEGYTDTGFLVNDVTVDGSLLCLRDLWMRWDVSSLADVTPDSIAMMFLLRPFPELLILGTGAHIAPVSPAVQEALRKEGIGLEIADTANAVATFNILTQEGRHVVAGLLPMRASVPEPR